MTDQFVTKTNSSYSSSGVGGAVLLPLVQPRTPPRDPAEFPGPEVRKADDPGGTDAQREDGGGQRDQGR